MLNPVQEYAKARSMPIPALVAVLQGKSDMVSLGVAHAALKEKTEAEIAQKGANAAMTAQAPKIINRDIAMAQGIAAMPTDVDVPMGGIVGNDGQMTDTAAGGGIVAFQAGGDPRAQLRKTPPTFVPRTAVDPRAQVRPTFPSVSATGQPLSPVAPSPSIPRQPGMFSRAAQSLLKSPIGRAIPGSLLFSELLSSTPANVGEEDQLNIYRTLLGLGYTEEDVRNMPPEIRKQIVDTVSQSQAQEAQQDQQAPQVQPTPSAAPQAAAPQAAQPSGIAALPSTAPATDYATRMTDAETMARKGMTAETPKTAKQFMEERDTLLRDAGYDFNLVKNQIKEVREEKEGLKGDRKEAMNLRLIEAGLGILGGESPYAFVNIGKGATPALQGLAKDIKEIKKDSRALDREVRQLNAMQNEIAAGRASYGIEALNKQADRIARREESIQRSRDSIFGTIVGKETQLEVAGMQSQTQREVAGMQAGALRIERDLARQDARAKVALDAAEQAARDISDPTEKTAAVKKFFREFYNAAYGGGATATDPADAARAELARRGLK